MLELLVSVFVFGGLFLTTWLLMTQPPHKIMGVYPQPTRNYWFKVLFFYSLIQIRKLQLPKKKSERPEELFTSGYGVKSRSKIEEMECAQTLSTDPKAFDAVYFNAADGQGNYLVLATARRPKGVINGLLYIRIPEIGLLQLPKMPDTLLFGNEEKFEAEGISILPLEPMKAWKLQYSGTMKGVKDELKKYEVKLDANWISRFDYFDFDTDMDPWSLSKCMALEEWSAKYFEALKSAHQTHYEQMGMIVGTISIDGKTFELKLNSMRDHSYGHRREWKLMHRYGFHMIHTEDGYSMNIGMVCQPVTCSQLELGYVNTPSGGSFAISSVDLPLWQHGEGGTPPVDYAFSFVANGVVYYVEVEVLESPEFYIGWEWETRIVERMAVFKVNGKKGWGIAEWDYRHFGGRPKSFADSDPEWAHTLNKG